MPDQQTPAATPWRWRYGCPLCLPRLETVGDKRRHLRETHPLEVGRG